MEPLEDSLTDKKPFFIRLLIFAVSSAETGFLIIVGTPVLENTGKYAGNAPAAMPIMNITRVMAFIFKP